MCSLREGNTFSYICLFTIDHLSQPSSGTTWSPPQPCSKFVHLAIPSPDLFKLVYLEPIYLPIPTLPIGTWAVVLRLKGLLVEIIRLRMNPFTLTICRPSLLSSGLLLSLKANLLVFSQSNLKDTMYLSARASHTYQINKGS